MLTLTCTCNKYASAMFISENTTKYFIRLYIYNAMECFMENVSISLILYDEPAHTWAKYMFINSNK